MTIKKIELPIEACRDQILRAVADGRNLVVRAPTGSGKSTQVPQMLLDSGLAKEQILVLQPRRIAARLLATRVASERNTPLGSIVGFQTRFEREISDQTRICFITEGILPRMLISDPLLSKVSIVVFDEFHERSLAIDMGLALISDLQRTRRPDLRIVVMSATIDVNPLREYLRDVCVVESSGRTWPVQIRYAPPQGRTPVWESAAASAQSLISEGAAGDILIFMPGAYEIRKTIEALQRTIRGESIIAMPLYGDLPGQRQQATMEPQGRRKIIVATNIAETSLTIPGVRHVIDSGLARINRYDQGRGFNMLFIEPISVDAADQRAGRAGREDAGICVRLWSATSHATRSHHTTPEVARVDLAEALLQIRRLGYQYPKTFPWFQSPADTAVERANTLLLMLGACASDGTLTDAGKTLCLFPMHPRLSRLLIEASTRGATRLAAFCAALLSERPFVSGRPDYPLQALEADVSSDLFGQYCLLDLASSSGYDPSLCARLNINVSAARSVERTMALYLAHCKKHKLPTHDTKDAPYSLAMALLAAYPDHLASRRDKGTLICNLSDSRRGELSRDSMVRSAHLLVATEIREIKNSDGTLKTILSMATEVREEWLLEFFGDQLQNDVDYRWDSSSRSIASISQTRCLGVIIEEKIGVPTDLQKAGGLLADRVASGDLKLDNWDSTVEEWIDRVNWVAKNVPESEVPVLDQAGRRRIIDMLCANEYRYNAVKEKEVMPFVREMLTPKQRSLTDQIAPATLLLPCGRNLRIQYRDEPPRARARIQELYGLTATPRVGNGKFGVLLEILAPNNRPVQITDDLAGFWVTHYPELKKQLSRRYPRHEWR